MLHAQLFMAVCGSLGDFYIQYFVGTLRTLQHWYHFEKKNSQSAADFKPQVNNPIFIEKKGTLVTSCIKQQWLGRLLIDTINDQISMSNTII